MQARVTADEPSGPAKQPEDTSPETPSSTSNGASSAAVPVPEPGLGSTVAQQVQGVPRNPRSNVLSGVALGVALLSLVLSLCACTGCAMLLFLLMDKQVLQL